jgi:hypothetical protein
MGGEKRGRARHGVLVSLLNNVVHVSISPTQENRESGKAPTIGKVMHKSRFQPSKRSCGPKEIKEEYLENPVEAEEVVA